MRQPFEWGDLCKDAEGKLSPIGGLALDFNFHSSGGGMWRACWVLGWDAEANRYLVRWCDDEDDENAETARVLSLHCFIQGDDPMLFADRVAAAHKLRRQADSMLK